MWHITCNQIDSTNLAAKRLIHRGVATPFSLIARRQRHGRGSHGRHWFSDDEGGLYYSLAISPFDPNRYDNLTIRVAQTCRTVIHQLFDINIDIEWPNDLILSGKKIGGILTEATVGSGGQFGSCVIGIGINVNQAFFPDPISASAISLWQFNPIHRSIDTLSESLTKELLTWL